MIELKDISDISVGQLIGDSNQGEYLFRYLSKLSVKWTIIEPNYIDRDYLIDYSKYYSRCFGDIEKKATRIHFFSDKTNPDWFNIVFHSENQEEIEDTILEIQNCYLGFTVIKPITNEINQSIIGRTLLKTYDEEDGNERRFYVKSKNAISLYGINLIVDSLPFQAQDRVVGACATIACWTTLFPLNDLFGVRYDSPFEITDLSVNFPILSRNFPSDGLNIFQVKNYYNSIGLETEILKIKEINYAVNYHRYLLKHAICAFLNLGLPIIAQLKIDAGLHAAVITGYRHCNHEIMELYVHDDQIGPYSHVKSNDSFQTWINEWVNDYNKSKVELENLIIPIYPKIRLPFGRIWPKFAAFIDIVIRNEKVRGIRHDAKLLLYSLNDYKYELLMSKIAEKEMVLTEQRPKYLWVFREYENNDQKVQDVIYDATQPYAKNPKIIKYDYI